MLSRESVSISEMREGDREKSPTLLFSDRRGDEERTEAREIKIADRALLERRVELYTLIFTIAQTCSRELCTRCLSQCMPPLWPNGPGS